MMANNMKNLYFLLALLIGIFSFSGCSDGDLVTGDYSKSISGRIIAIDSNGDVVNNYPGVNVTTLMKLGDMKYVEIKAEVQTNGSFTFNNLNKNSSYDITVNWTDYATTIKRDVKTDTVEIHLTHKKFKPTQKITVRPEIGGFTASDVDVYLYYSQYQRDKEDLDAAFHKGKTDKSGNVETTVSPSSTSIFVLAKKSEGNFKYTGKTSFVPDNNPVIVTLDTSNYVLDISVTNSAGDPVPNADVRLYSNLLDLESDTLSTSTSTSTFALNSTKSDASGSAVFELPQAGKFYIRVKKTYTDKVISIGKSGAIDCKNYNLSKVKITL